MLKANGASATVLAPRRIGFLVFGVVSFVAVIAGFFMLQHASGCDLQLRQGCISLEKAATPQARTRGLSGRSHLASDRAMLFVYDVVNKPCLWMKDMHFSLDMVWLDANKRVISLVQDVSPDTFPRSFCPEEPAQYVLELPAGMAAHNQLEVGQHLRF